MDKRELTIRNVSKVFSVIITSTISPSFKMPKGGKVARVMDNWLDIMYDAFGTIKKDRIVDYAVCQAYRASKMGDKYMEDRWDISHSFSSDGKSWEAYASTSKGLKYYEDQWLGTFSLSRFELEKLIKDTSEHPLAEFIENKHEEYTKRRKLGTDVGFHICGKQTLMYTPFSESCSKCPLSVACIDRLKQKIPELYRIRMEAWENKGTQ